MACCSMPHLPGDDSCLIDPASSAARLEAARDQWEEEKQRLLRERAALQDAANRLNVEARDAKAEMKRTAKEGQRVKDVLQRVSVVLRNKH